MGIPGLNSEATFGRTSEPWLGGCHELRQDIVRPGHGLSDVEDISSDRGAAGWRHVEPDTGLCREIPGDGE